MSETSQQILGDQKDKKMAISIENQINSLKNDFITKGIKKINDHINLRKEYYDQEQAIFIN